MCAGFGCAIDLLTKRWIFAKLGSHYIQQGEPRAPIWLAEGWFGFETSLNEGALFGIGQGRVMEFAVLSVVAALAIFWWLFWARAAHDRLLTVALGCVTGGIFGNLYDRLGLPGLTWAAGVPGHSAGDRIYAVRDWLHFKIDAIQFDWPIFNLADCLLVCGAGLLVLHAFRCPPPQQQTVD
jgi:signal peptidase II